MGVRIHTAKRIVMLVLAAASAVLGGCGSSVYLHDDEGGHPHETDPLFGDHPDEISQPYAIGTRVNIEVRGLPEGANLADFRAESSNSAVLVPDQKRTDSGKLVFSCLAGQAGQASLRIVEGADHLRHEATLTVAAPDRVRVLAHEAMRLAGFDATSLDPAEVHEARILAGGTAVYAVAYFQGSTQLYGRGILAIDAPATLKIELRTTTGVVTNEWFNVTPSVEGQGTLGLRAAPGGPSLGSLPVTSVGAAAVTGLTIGQEPFANKKSGDSVWVGIRGADASGHAVDGVWADWTVGGVKQNGMDGDTSKTRGDLLRYLLSDGAAPRDAVASFNGLSATTTIRASDSWVMDTTYLGCAVSGPGGRRRGGALVLLGPALLGLALRRRRAALL